MDCPGAEKPPIAAALCWWCPDCGKNVGSLGLVEAEIDPITGDPNGGVSIKPHEA